jgi:hypothetical protein
MYYTARKVATWKGNSCKSCKSWSGSSFRFLEAGPQTSTTGGSVNVTRSLSNSRQQLGPRVGPRAWVWVRVCVCHAEADREGVATTWTGNVLDIYFGMREYVPEQHFCVSIDLDSLGA